MRAITVSEFGGPEVLKPGEVPMPGPGPDDVLVQVLAAVVIDHTRPDWPDQVRDATGGGAQRVLACAAPTLEGAARAARDGATIATPVHARLPESRRVTWQVYDGQPSGSRLIRMARWFDDGLLSVQVAARYYYEDAASAHRRAEEGHTQGKLVLVVDDDLALEWEV